MKELSKFKVLSITLLVTMTSCVAGTMDINAETLRSYGIEIDLNASDKVQTVQRVKKSKSQNNHKFRFGSLVETGRKHVIYRGLTIESVPVTEYLSSEYFIEPLINNQIRTSNSIYTSLFSGADFVSRAGPVFLLLK